LSSPVWESCWADIGGAWRNIFSRSSLPTVKKKKRREEKTTPWDRRKNVQITDNSNYCQNSPNLQNHYLDIIINLHLNPHQCYTCISYHHLTHVSITYFFCLKNYWSFGVKIFWGGSHRVRHQVVLCNFIKGFDWLHFGV
jgi:hypothetical protein